MRAPFHGQRRCAPARAKLVPSHGRRRPHVPRALLRPAAQGARVLPGDGFSSQRAALRARTGEAPERRGRRRPHVPRALLRLAVQGARALRRRPLAHARERTPLQHVPARRSEPARAKLQNVTGADGRTFVHRYAWRSEAPTSYDGDGFHAHANAHHCSTCRRYATDFDHHFGRRILMLLWSAGEHSRARVVGRLAAEAAALRRRRWRRFSACASSFWARARPSCA